MRRARRSNGHVSSGSASPISQIYKGVAIFGIPALHVIFHTIQMSVKLCGARCRFGETLTVRHRVRETLPGVSPCASRVPVLESTFND